MKTVLFTLILIPNILMASDLKTEMILRQAHGHYHTLSREYEDGRLVSESHGTFCFDKNKIDVSDMTVVPLDALGCEEKVLINRPYHSLTETNCVVPPTNQSLKMISETKKVSQKKYISIITTITPQETSRSEITATWQRPLRKGECCREAKSNAPEEHARHQPNVKSKTQIITTSDNLKSYQLSVSPYRGEECNIRTHYRGV